ncbi:MAG: hypothetical protein HRF45_11950 [Fimbriimonadia bacterium]
MKVLTRYKRCGEDLQLVTARDSNPREPGGAFTEYTYVCSSCGSWITMVEA